MVENDSTTVSNTKISHKISRRSLLHFITNPPGPPVWGQNRILQILSKMDQNYPKFACLTALQWKSLLKTKVAGHAQIILEKVKSNLNYEQKSFVKSPCLNLSIFGYFRQFWEEGVQILKNPFCIELLGLGRPRPIICPYLEKCTVWRQSVTEKS